MHETRYINRRLFYFYFRALLLICRSLFKQANELSGLTHLFLLHVKLFDDDANKEIESEERAEDDEQHEVQVHVRPVLFVRLLVVLSKQNHTSTH